MARLNVTPGFHPNVLPPKGQVKLIGHKPVTIGSYGTPVNDWIGPEKDMIGLWLQPENGLRVIESIQLLHADGMISEVFSKDQPNVR